MSDASSTLPPRPDGEDHPSGKEARGSRRRRAFIAVPERIIENSGSADDTPIAPLPATEDEDLPVLTEVVSLEAEMSEDKAMHLDETQLSLLASVITHAIEQQLAHDLPALIDAALHHAGDNLRAGIATSLENALHEILSRYK